MKLWDCYLCGKRYIQKGRIIRHLVSKHNKKMFPKEDGVESAKELSDKCEFNFQITKEVIK